MMSRVRPAGSHIGAGPSQHPPDLWNISGPCSTCGFATSASAASVATTRSTMPRSPPAPRRGLPPWQIRRVIAYMSERLDQNIGLDELAGLTSLSRSHFCTAFRDATGRTPHEWLTGLRLGRAQQLLRDPKARITDVALAVGYQTPSAFTAAFWRHTGATPSDYRRCFVAADDVNGAQPR
jgi:transcriptional regulator GlxA family with amidase domain